MSDKNVELMKKLIEAKQQKSNNQSGSKRGPNSLGSARSAVKRQKKGGLFDK